MGVAIGRIRAAGDDAAVGEFFHGAVDGFRGEVEVARKVACGGCAVEHGGDAGEFEGGVGLGKFGAEVSEEGRGADVDWHGREG